MVSVWNPLYLFIVFLMCLCGWIGVREKLVFDFEPATEALSWQDSQLCIQMPQTCGNVCTYHVFIYLLALNLFTHLPTFIHSSSELLIQSRSLQKSLLCFYFGYCRHRYPCTVHTPMTAVSSLYQLIKSTTSLQSWGQVHNAVLGLKQSDKMVTTYKKICRRLHGVALYTGQRSLT